MKGKRLIMRNMEIKYPLNFYIVRWMFPAIFIVWLIIAIIKHIEDMIAVPIILLLLSFITYLETNKYKKAYDWICEKFKDEIEDKKIKNLLASVAIMKEDIEKERPECIDFVKRIFNCKEEKVSASAIRKKKRKISGAWGSKKEIFWAFILLSLLFIPSINASGNNFIILRANVNPLYIAHEPVQVQAFILVFRNGKPTDESATLHIDIKGLNINYSYSEDITIPGGRRKTYSLPALNEGHYKITFFAQKGGVNSQKIVFEYGVTKSPVPYDAHFTPDGSKFYFKSLKLNETGQIDANYTFTLKIYSWIPPNEATLIRTIENVTDITISIPSSIMKSGGIAVVEIRDKWGWINSATMDLSSFNFAGIPCMYDYGYQYREPVWQRRLPMLAATIIFIIAAIVVLFYLMRWYGG